tara:strand:- start:1586 stop:2416 length:831 start_codon:yes stop_codon:yes gene_type:complete
MKLIKNENKELSEEFKQVTNTLRYTAVFHLKYFSEIVMTNTKGAFASLCECEASLEEILNKTITIKFDKIDLKSRIITNFLVDKIVLTSIGNTNADCVAILTAATEFLTACTGKAILVSGYLSYGHFYLNKTRHIMCGKPYIMADQFAGKIQFNALVCDKIIEQNLEEARLFTKDEELFTTLGKSLMTTWDVPIFGSLLEGGLVKQSMVVVDWPRYSLDIFETIRSYSIEEFYTPFKTIHGALNTVTAEKRMHIEETVSFLNHQLAESVKLLNSTI